MQPLCALVLASLPMLMITAVALFVLDSPLDGVGSLITQMRESVSTYLVGGDAMAVGLSLMALLGQPLDFTQLIASVPTCVLFIAVYLFIGMPIAVSTSGFLLSFLRGKGPKATDVYGCFSGKYPRAFAGMLYKQFWALIWGCAVIAVPILFGVGTYSAAWTILDTQMSNLQFQVYFFIGDVAVSVVLFIVLLVLFFNRLLAYCLTPVCLAAQPNLSPFRAVRLSRKLMRGQKSSLIGLYLSFISFYLPAIVSGVALAILGSLTAWLSLEDGVVSLIRIGLLVIIGLNALVTLYVAPYAALCVRAFYIERKREALLDEELTREDFGSEPARG